MLPEALAALASAGGTAVVTAMVTDGWDAAKLRVSRLLGRGDVEKIAAIAERLERDRGRLARLDGEELERARAARVAAWETRLADLLEESPEVAAPLREWLAGLGAGAVNQHVVAYDNAQQATQGTGIQHNTFYGRPHA